LRANLGRHYCVEGHWTKALEQWERAWDATRQYQTGAGKRIADYTLAYWTRLLVELGRMDELQVIFAEAEGRHLDGGPLLQRYLRTKEMYGVLRLRPELTYRCGWLVFDHLALATRGQSLAPRQARDLYRESNLLQNCSMSALAQIALKERWSMMGVERPEGSTDLPMPSIMHVKQGHYVALLRADGDRVLAYDPIFGTRHFRREVLNAESSGRFLLEAGPLPAGWRALSADEMATTVGRSGGDFPGYGFMDTIEGDCGDCCGDDQGSSGSAGNGYDYILNSMVNKNDIPISCGVCGKQGSPQGMPQWRVSEPNLNLWLRDRPISCQPAYGPAVALDLEFKQRDEAEWDEDIFSFGPGWHSRWRSRVSCYPERGFQNGARAYVWMPGGGILNLQFQAGETVADQDYYYNCRLTATLDGNGSPIAFTLEFPDGRKYVYDFVDEAGRPYCYYMSSSVDQQGFVTRYNYVLLDGGYQGQMLRLATVADQENNLLFSLQYTNTTDYSSLVSVVTDRFGRSAQLSYGMDASGNTYLSQIQDAAGLPSTISYDANAWPQTLATPYGSTTFQYDEGPVDWWNTYRRVRITEPNGGSQTYLFTTTSASLLDGSPWMPYELPDGLVPDQPQGTTIDRWFQTLNSFHWNQRQNFDLPTDLSQFTTNDFNKARMRHWLATCSDFYVPDFALSAEVAPSQSDDGSTLGQITFYDYVGKPNPAVRGTQIQPSLVARRLPDGSTWYTAYQRNSFSLPTSATSTYGTGNPASTRTYTYTYAANDQDVVQVQGPGNVLLATYGYNTRHQKTSEVLWPDSSTSYTNTWAYDTEGRLQSKTTAAGQTTTYTYSGSSGTYSGYLSGTSEQPVQRSESFTWLNVMIQGYTDYRGLAITNFWDGLNRPTGKLYPDGTTTSNLYTRATAYPNGTGGLNILDVTGTRDRLGHWTGFDYDALRRITAKTNANGVVTRYGYCDCGAASYITNAWGTPVQQVTVFTFDNQDNRIMASYADGYSTTNWFNALGQSVTSGDGTGYRWFFYNNQGLQTAVGYSGILVAGLEQKGRKLLE